MMMDAFFRLQNFDHHLLPLLSLGNSGQFLLENLKLPIAFIFMKKVIYTPIWLEGE